MKTSDSVVVVSDFDGDGDLDIFVGGRVVPDEYPMTKKICLLRNDRGKYVDVTASLCNQLSDLGMVTAAPWSDFDNYGKSDLILAG